MKKSQVGRYQFLLALVVIVNAGMVWAQSNATQTADGPVPEGMIAFITDTSAGSSTFARQKYPYSENVNEPQLSSNGVMVAEDMRCRQCRGKCAADNLRCRSQCIGDSACLVQCEERSSKCEEMCKQIFQCE
jgi:hypothetical protein